MDRRHTAVLFTALWLVAGGVFGFVVRPAEAVQLGSLPPDTQRAVKLILTGFSPYVRQLSVKAIQLIPPERAGTMARNLQLLRSYPDAQVIQVGRQFDFVIQLVLMTIPRNADQYYINGLWGVSDREEQFSVLVAQRLVHILNAAAPGTPDVPRTPPPVGIQDPGLFASWHGMWCTLGGGC